MKIKFKNKKQTILKRETYKVLMEEIKKVLNESSDYDEPDEDGFGPIGGIKETPLEKPPNRIQDKEGYNISRYASLDQVYELGKKDQERFMDIFYLRGHEGYGGDIRPIHYNWVKQELKREGVWNQEQEQELHLDRIESKGIRKKHKEESAQTKANIQQDRKDQERKRKRERDREAQDAGWESHAPERFHNQWP